MAVISITVTESSEQIVAGIPKTVAIATNTPAVIFYTLDDTTPTLFSTQYTGPIILPVSSLKVILKIMASNGVDSSPIVSEVYITNIINNIRLAHSGTTAAAQENIPDLYPFGSQSAQKNIEFTNPAEVGITVDNPALPSTSTGFDGNGNPTGFTNQPYDLTNYNIKYTTTDWQNKSGVGIGTLPSKVTVIRPTEIPETTSQNSTMFDPRALVIFQDSTKENPNDPPNINRMNFTLEDPEKTRDGNNFYTSGLDSPPISGSFVKSYHNPRTNMITYYYFNSWNNKWIISTSPYNSNGPWDGNMSGVGISTQQPGSKYVFEWIPFARRILF